MAIDKKRPYVYQLWLLLIAGTICSLCEGFDGIVAFMGWFFSTPGAFVCAIGLAFAIISSVIFYHTDLHDVTETLGLTLSLTSVSLDKAIAVLDDIHDQSDRIEKGIFRTKSLADLQEYHQQVTHLLHQHTGLDNVRSVYRRALKQQSLYWMKRMMAMLVGVMFFGNGFFSAQAVVIFFYPASLMTWPALLFCCSVGFSSWWVHWKINGPDIENIVNRWFGLEQHKLDLLLDPDVTNATQQKLNTLLKHVEYHQKIGEENSGLNAQVRQLSRTLHGLRFFNPPAVVPPHFSEAQNEAELGLSLSA